MKIESIVAPVTEVPATVPREDDREAVQRLADGLSAIGYSARDIVSMLRNLKKAEPA